MYKYLTEQELAKKVATAKTIMEKLPQLSPEETAKKFGGKFKKYVSGGTEMPYTIQVRIWNPKEGEGIFNELELREYTSKDKGFHAKGTAGEEWIIPFKNLHKYTKLDGSPLTEEDLQEEWLTVRRAVNYTYLAQSDEAIVVHDPWGGAYYCPANSFVACAEGSDGKADPSGCWVINEHIVIGTNKLVVE